MKNILFMCAVILIFTNGLCYASETKKNILTKGKLIAQWNFNRKGKKTVVDSSGGNHHGRIIGLGKYTQWVQGKSGHALEFSGAGTGKNGGIEIRNMPKIFPRGLTISFWVKLGESYKYGGFHEFISNAFKGKGPGFRFVIFYNSLMWRTGDGKKYTQVCSARQEINIPKKEWFHLAVTTDDKHAAIYLNGMKVAGGKNKLIPINGNDIWYIGSYRWGYAYPLEGAMDEIKVFDCALSEKDILEEYNSSR